MPDHFTIGDAPLQLTDHPPAGDLLIKRITLLLTIHIDCAAI